MEINNIIDLYNYFNLIGYNCINYDILENFLIFENIDNKKLLNLINLFKELNINILQLHLASNKDLIICLDNFKPFIMEV